MPDKDFIQHLSQILLKKRVLMLFGPKTVGKRFLTPQLAKKAKLRFYEFDLSKRADRQKLVHPDLLFASYAGELVVLNEIEWMPSLLQDIINATTRPKSATPRFIIISNFQPATFLKFWELPASWHFQEVFPEPLPEALKKNSECFWEHWLRGGFPNFLSAPSHRVLANRAEKLIKSSLFIDTKTVIGTQLSHQLLMRCLELVAQLNGTILNMQVMARSLGVTGPTAQRYLDFLEAVFLIRRLPALSLADGKRLIKAPKIFVRDTGLLHHLLGIQTIKTLSKSVHQAHSREGYVLEEIAKLLPAKFQLHYYKTQHAAEIQIVVTKTALSGTKSPYACVSLEGPGSQVTKGWKNGWADLATKRNYIISNHPETSTIVSKSDNYTLIALPEFLRVITGWR